MSAPPARARWFVRGDIDGFFGLAVDNVVQLLVIDALCRFVLGFPAELVHGRILPGAALSILVGNLFYSWQAMRLSRATGRSDVCALPYGINTPSVFAYVFLVMLPVKLSTGDAQAAWRAGLVAALGSGLIELSGAPLAGWGLAMFTHAMHNLLATVPFFGELTCLLGSILDWLGVLFMFIVIISAGWAEQRTIAHHLREEVQMGIITPSQYRTASSGLALSFAWLASLFSGKFFATSRFYQVTAELAHKKEQLSKHGEESGNSALVQKYRQELAALSPRAQD